MPKKIIVKMMAKAKLPTSFFGLFEISVFKSNLNDRTQVVLQSKKIAKGNPLVRLHSKCLTGDTFTSLRCDCGKQLDISLKMIAKQGGVLIYLDQEGRDIGLVNKIKAYNLQDKKMDTVEANVALGLPVDARDYGVAAAILKKMKITKIELLTNNPEKVSQLINDGIQVIKTIPLEIKPNKFNKNYLKTKKLKMGHILKLV